MTDNTWMLLAAIGLLVGLSSGCQSQSAGASPLRSWLDTPETSGATDSSSGSVQPAQHTEPVEPEPQYDYPTNASATDGTGFDEQLEQGLKTLVGRGPNQEVAKQAYADGEELFRQKKYSQAADKFHQAADRWPNSILEEDAMYMRAESLFFADDYATANEEFGELLNKYENSRHMDKALQRQFAIANFWLETHQKDPGQNYVPNITDDTLPWIDLRGRTAKSFENIHLKDPTGPLADDALFAAAGIHFAAAHWDEADFLYDQLLQNHADSKYFSKAQYLSVRAKLRKYQGAEYDGKPLEQAEQRMLQMLHENPAEIPGAPEGERQRLLQAKAAVRLQLAERDYNMGLYYENRGQYQSARFYHQLVIEQYGDTPWAKKSHEKMLALKDKQETPSRFTWLDHIFPDPNPFPTPIQNPPAQ